MVRATTYYCASCRIDSARGPGISSTLNPVVYFTSPSSTVIDGLLATHTSGAATPHPDGRTGPDTNTQPTPTG